MSPGARVYIEGAKLPSLVTNLGSTRPTLSGFQTRLQIIQGSGVRNAGMNCSETVAVDVSEVDNDSAGFAG
ncbi:unnamed protein product [Calypogeia fissa]